MKELENQPQKKDSIEIIAQAEVKKEIKLIGSQRVIPGLTLWQFNLISGVLTKALFKSEDLVLDFTKHNPAKDLAKRKKVIIEENCVYFQALNTKNALKVLRRKKIIK
jgi:hypothetical protein